MAQNAKTSGGPSSSSGGRKSKLATNPKKGARAIAPKKHSAVVSRSLQKSMSAKINNSIERQMVNAASAGKLNLMKPPAQGGSTGQESTEKAAKDKNGVARPEKTGIKRPKINPHERGNI